jgi:sigma-B regulation protein RsbU (phosphoserine phosphatase)
MATSRNRKACTGITAPENPPWGHIGGHVWGSVEATQAERTITALEDRLAQSALETAELRRELYEAAQVQRHLCGARQVRRGCFEIAAEMFPVSHISGDFFCIDDLGSATLLSIGDICGKGLMAGMWFIHILELVRMYGVSNSDPAAALRALNYVMCAMRPAPPLTSVFLSYVDCSRRELLYSNAGHPAPVLLRADGTPQLLNEGGPVLGAIADAEFHGASFTLEAGDTLAAFSDGITECRNERDEEFETARIIRELLRKTPLSAAETLFSIVGAARDFAGTQRRDDDCTLLVARCLSADAA